MVQERVSGNGGFGLSIEEMLRRTANAPAVIDQPFIDPVADAFAADVDDMVDELRFNPSSNLAEEAQQIMNSPLAAKLGAGVMADLRAAVQLQEEKAANGADAFTRGDRAWEDRKERDDKDRKEQARIADMADDANNGQLSTKPDQFGNSQQDYADLNNELKTRDGQERMMAFLRMMYPNMSEAQIKERMLDIKAVAAVEEGAASKEEKERVAKMPPEKVSELKGNVAEYKVMSGSRSAPKVETQADAQAVTISANAHTETVAAETQVDLLAGRSVAPATSSTRTSLTSQVEGRGEFAATAPSLRDHHRAAMAATAPLDQPAPQQIASAAPVGPAAGVSAGGFDV